MNVLVYEHACGGGYAEGVVSPGILAEGFGMLRSCVAGLKLAGHRVSVVVDEGLSLCNFPVDADCVIPVFSFRDAQQAILRVCASVDAAYVIAPETGGVLPELVRFIGQQGVSLLNSCPDAIRVVSDKMGLYNVLRSSGLRVPRTVLMRVSDFGEAGFMGGFGFSFPVVVKPVDGVGCSGLSLVEDLSQVGGAVRRVVSELGCDVFMVQEYLVGEHVSVSLLCAGGRGVAVSLNRQNVSLALPDGVSCYSGGVVPFCSGDVEREVFRVAEAVVGCFSGLRGYVGVDMVLTGSGPVVLDVNPRLTTSFIGLSRVADFNVANAILDASLHGVLPSDVSFLGFSCFSKLETPNVDRDVLDALCGMSDVVSPPFPVQDSKTGCAMLSVEDVSCEEACCRLEKVKGRVLGMCRGGVGSFG
ncbi:MAG: ATP-grasp domain-containing protein [Nitrososphaerota archaeon]|nr:ATP-grasp domain-containing protein [Nitrososphaerota archaeon]